MEFERWQRIEELYHAALACESSERRDFVLNACVGDEELRGEVESLLENYRDDEFIEDPIAETALRLVIDSREDSLAGQKIDHYRVVSLLGAGAMGEVYLAEDASLGRMVALKLLPVHLTSDKDRLRRFKQEARVASALNHPNILTVYEIGEENSRNFIATEFIEGETLRDRLAESKIGIDAALNVTLQAASALSAAHAKGVVHRDIKPENIMVRDDGYIKVLDFGLAKLTEQPPDALAASTLAHTEPGMLMGTVKYMSPEQARAEDVDARTDIWSLGVVLYEAVAGRVPHDGASSTEALVSILEHEAPPLTQQAPEAPAELERIVHRCLEKSREMRYASAEQLVADLESLKRAMESGEVATTLILRAARRRTFATRWKIAAALGLAAAVLLAGLASVLLFGVPGGAPQPKVNSIAVLPLENLSGDQSQDYFADGMTEALITDLARLSGFKRVIARASVMRYKGAAKPLSEIARELKVDALLTGSVLRSGDRVRITVQLVDATGEDHLWAERYEGDLRDVLALQNEVVAAITGEIKLHLTPREQAQLASARRVNPEAHEAYLKGRAHFGMANPEDANTAMEQFQLALNKDPNYALAYVGISQVWASRSQYGIEPADVVMPKAKEAALKAIELEDTLSEAHVALANVRKFYEWDWNGAEESLRHAIELSPNTAGHRIAYASFLGAMRRPQEAQAQLDHALELDPVNSFLWTVLGHHLCSVGKYDEGIEQFRSVLILAPKHAAALNGLWQCLQRKEMYDEALTVVAARFAALDHPEIVDSLARGYREGGYRRAMILAAETAARPSARPIRPFMIAQLYGHAGDADRAIEWLERAYAIRDPDMPYLSFASPFREMHGDPRFQDLLRRMNLPN